MMRPWYEEEGAVPLPDEPIELAPVGATCARVPEPPGKPMSREDLCARAQHFLASLEANRSPGDAPIIPRRRRAGGA